MSSIQRYLNLCLAEQWAAGLFRSVEIRGDSMCLKKGTYSGAVCLAPIDSAERAFVWRRLKIGAVLSGESGVTVYARASDEPVWGALDAAAKRGRAPEQLQQLYGEPAGTGTDLLLTQTGRYLWLAFELTGNGVVRPQIDSIALWMEGDHMMDYLPAFYHDQDFTYRYLSVFNSMLQDMEAQIEEMERNLDPSCASPEMLDFLAGWLAMDPGMDEASLREQLPKVLEDYESMYTVEGIRRTIRRLTGQDPMIIEHFQVDPNSPTCSNPELNRRLYGDNPYRFFVMLPQGTFAGRKEMEQFLELMQDKIPAETEMELIMLKPEAQLDGYTYLGVNTQVSDYLTAAIDDATVLNDHMTIGGAMQ